jgi:Uma2 family endonuclease
MARDANATVRAMRAMTLDEWANMDEDEDGELVDGYLVEEEVPSLRHECAVTWLILAVGQWVKQHGGRIYGSELKFRIDNRRGRKPDISIDLTRARPMNDGRLQTQMPDILVEVVTAGPRDERRDRVEKMTDYARARARWYWIVDPALGSFEVFELTERGTYARVAAATEGTVTEIPGCEGLVLDLDALWSELEDAQEE